MHNKVKLLYVDLNCHQESALSNYNLQSDISSIMINKPEKHDYNAMNKIMERPIDFFYNNVTTIITMSFDNLPETSSADTETWNKFLLDSWNKYFAQLENIFDFLKSCVYYTCLAGRFYKMNCSLSLDDSFYLIKDRLPNPDTSFKIWHQLHKLARAVLIEKCKESSSDASLVLDLHTRTDGVCVDSQDKENILDFVYLPNEEERVLVFHITVRYSNFEEKLSSTISENPSDFNSDFNGNRILDTPEVSKETPASSLKQSDLSSKSLKDSNDTGDWEKYGARPKSKQYFQKNGSDTTASLKEYEKIDFPEKSDEKIIKHSQIRNFRNRDRSYSRLSPTFERINKMIGEVEQNRLNEDYSKYQDFSFSSFSAMPSLQNFTAKGSVSETSDNTAESRRQLLDFQDSQSPSRSGMIKRRDSCISNREYPRHLISAASDSKPPPIERDSFCPSPVNIPRPEDIGSDYGKYGARPKDQQYSQQRDCKITGDEKVCKPPDYFEENTAEPAVHDLISPQSFPKTECIGGVFATVELEKVTEDILEVQKKYEEAILNLTQSKATDESLDSDSTDNERLARSLNQEQFTSMTQRDTTLKMPFICFAQDTAGDDKFFYTMNATEYEGLGARESMIRYYMKTFFDNCKFVGTSFEDNTSLGASNPVEDFSSNFRTAESEFDTIPFMEAKNSEEANTAEMRALSYEDENSRRFAVRTFDEKISFDWEYFSKEKSPPMSNQRSRFFPGISAVNDENATVNKNVLTVDGKQIPLETTDEAYDAFFETFVQKLTESPTKSPQNSGKLQSTFDEQSSTPEKKSKYSDLLKSVHLENSDEEKSQDELLFDLCDESLELSDYSPESDSVEIADDEGSDS